MEHVLTVGKDPLATFESASSREWLVTNGIGGYASGTLSGANTRRYHGLLVAALTPPTERMTLLSKLEETIAFCGHDIELSSNEYPGTVHPDGWRFLERYENNPAPTFWFRPRPDVLLRKTVWMARGEHTTYVRYTLVEAPADIDLKLTPLVCWKSFHAEMHPWDGFPSSLEAAGGEARIRFTPDSPELRMTLKGARWDPAGYWHYNVVHGRERERGLDCQEDLYCPGHLRVSIKPGQSHTFIATIESRPSAPEKKWAALQTRREELMRGLGMAGDPDDFAASLALAADQFVIERGRRRGGSAPARLPLRSTIIAGYHWFADWGRDTMIALPGLCLETGRFEVARDILTSFAQYASQGMLPNRFPDQGEEPEYNTVDATLWYFEAIRRYVEAASDGLSLANELMPVLADMIDCHVRGTRYGIGVDPADGLLHAGVEGVQLTWMDAKVGDRVITPRIGKPVEIQALWINALRTVHDLSGKLGVDPLDYAARADVSAESFRRLFVRPDGLGLYDVLGDSGPDASIRPNQIIAASLPSSPLSSEVRESVVRTVEKHLLTPFGLRTLAPDDPAYCPHYGGGVVERDSAYHQGTVWPWLLGPFVEAHLRVYRNPEMVGKFLEPLRMHLLDAGLGSISEVFDAEPPYRPNGCIAQAWSVAEALRARRLVAAYRKSR